MQTLKITQINYNYTNIEDEHYIMKVLSIYKGVQDDIQTVEPNLLNIRDICKVIMPGADDIYSEELRLEVDLLDTRWQNVLKLAHIQNENLLAGLKRSEDFIQSVSDMDEWLSERHEEFVAKKTYQSITDVSQFHEYSTKISVSSKCISIYYIIMHNYFTLT